MNKDFEIFENKDFGRTYTTKEISEMMGYSVRSINRLIKKVGIKTILLKGKNMIPYSELHKIKKHFIKENQDIKNNVRARNERYLQIQIKNYLKKNLYVVCEEVKSSFGNIDLIATKDNETLLIEIKYNLTTHKMMESLGQLIAYSEDYPNAKLILYSNKDIQETFKSLLRRNKIEFKIYEEIIDEEFQIEQR